MPAPGIDQASNKLGTPTKLSTDPSIRNYDTLMHITRDLRHLPRSVLVSSLVINVLGLGLPLVTLQVYDRILPNRAIETLWLLIFGLCCVVFLESAMKIARVKIMSSWTLETGLQSEIEAVGRFLLAEKKIIAGEGKDVWLEGLDAISDLNKFYGGPAQLILLDIPFALIYLAVMALVGGTLILVPIVLVMLFALHAGRKGSKLQIILRNRTDRDTKRYDFIVECLSGIQTIKSFVMEPQMQRRFERLQQSSFTNSFDTILSTNYIQSLGSLFSNLILVFVVGVGAVSVIHGDLSVGAVACCSLLSSRLAQPVLRGIGIWTELQTVAVAHQRAAPLFALLAPPPLAAAAGHLKGEIAIRDVSLGAGGRGFALRNVSLDIEPGQIIGLRGSERSGRAELIKIMMGDLRPESGAVYFDGHDVSEDTFAKLSKDICYVSNHSPLFQGTLLQNIAMFRTGPALESARRATRLIGLEDDIFRLPEGYETAVGDHVAGVLAEGFQQRIAIARALAQAPMVLFFDEANAKLDRISDQKLRRGLERIKGQITLIVASNRPSFLAICDAVYEVGAEGLVQVTPDGSPIDMKGGIRPGTAKRAGDGGVA